MSFLKKIFGSSSSSSKKYSYESEYSGSKSEVKEEKEEEMRRYDDSDKEEDDDGGSYYQTPKEQSDDEDDEETNRRETLRRVARNIQYGYDNYLPQCNEYPGEEHLLDAPLKNWRYLFPTEEEVARRNSMRRAARIMQDGYDNYLPKYNEYPGEDLSGPFNKKFHLHLHDHDDDDD